MTDEAQETPYFLFVGRMEKLKGLQTLIPIFLKHQKAELLIAGSGSYEPQLRRLAVGNGNVRFVGYLSGPQLEALYRRAVAVIVPSLCFESFSLVVIEAFRQQTPVVVRNLGGMPELIQESGAGFIYNTDEELVAAMELLLINSSLRTEMGHRGYQAYLGLWTPEKHLQKYLDFIHNIQRQTTSYVHLEPASP